eukprot:Gb_12819 [translate_table: standard]
MAVVAVGDPETRLLDSECSLFKVSNTTLFNENLEAVLESLRAKIASTGFATSQQVEGSDPVYGLAQCRKDKSPSDCLKCFSAAEKKVRNCSNDTGLGNKQICGSVEVTEEANQFVATSQTLLDDLCAATPSIDGFFAAQMRQLSSDATKIYALAQCTRSVSESGCRECLRIANSNIKTCFPVTDGRAVDVGCYLRYSTSSFFPSNATTDLTPFLSSGRKSKSKLWIIVGVVGGVIGVSLMILLFMFRHSLLLDRFRPPLQKQEDASGATELRGPVNFDYKILRDATRNFDASNKLGEGGFGQVYKGTIKNGRTVAVKKLSLGQSPRVIAEFESEVKLISNVHHRNLVRFLGCCNKGPERLLVYEYMPNGSLDRVLFGENRKCLSWEQRFEIILGTARGIAYLHEDFHTLDWQGFSPEIRATLAHDLQERYLEAEGNGSAYGNCGRGHERKRVPKRRGIENNPACSPMYASFSGFQTTIQPAFIDVAHRLRGESSTSGTSTSQSNATVSVSLSAR